MPASKSPGIDNIPVRAIKDSLSATLPVITSLINASFTRGIFPRSWNLAVVSPILKDGNHEEPNNNRPISLLPILSKVCERVAPGGRERFYCFPLFAHYRLITTSVTSHSNESKLRLAWLV